MWTLRMAWRDSRGSRRRLLLFLASMVFGVAALVAINAFGDNLQRAVDEQARELLGADLSLERNTPFSPRLEALIDSLGGEQARHVTFNSMAYFPSIEKSRLATVRALDGEYPFYGQIETDPPEAARTYRDGQNALVEASLLESFEVGVGDSVQIGSRRYRIAGALGKTPRENAAVGLFSPRVYVPRARLDSTLLGFGSRVSYEVYFRFEPGRDPEAIREALEDRLRAQDVGIDTVREEQENWGEALGNLNRFLGLVGFMALLLGGLGVASAVHVYVKQRLETIAVLRCIGAKAGRTFRIYLIQAAALGIVGGLLGCALGVAVQTFLPRLVTDFLPVDVAFAISWRALAAGFGVGVGVTLLFALLPLLNVRRVSPLRALRAAYEEERRRDPWRWAVFALLAAVLTGFAVAQAPFWQVGVGYAVAVGLVFALLAAVAKGMMVLVRRFFPSSWAYPWRQGLANLYRPNNQTVVLMLALGLGTFLIMTLLLVERSLLAQIDVAGGDGRPDLILFDIQADQIDGVEALLEAEQVPVIDQAPIVTMRLHAIKGRTLEELRADSTFDLTWAHTREYRSTYRGYLTDSEEVVAGAFVGEVAPGAGVVPISIEQDLAENELGVALGDTLVFDVQGRFVPTVVGSIREVDWQRMQTNFFVVFPSGSLDAAPQMHVVMTRAGSEAATAQVQSAIVRAFPNVSAISLALVLDVFDAIFDRINFAIRFMALFSILTGLLVLAGAVLVSRYQRVGESVLLKTLGASRSQVFRILLIEYFFLGLLASLTGLGLSLAASGALAVFVFDTPLVAPLPALLAAVAVVTGLTVGIGLLNSRGIYARPPLEVLRAAG